MPAALPHLTRCTRLPGLTYVNPVLTPVMSPWSSLSAVEGTETRYRILADLYVRASRPDAPTDAMAQDLVVLQYEARGGHDLACLPKGMMFSMVVSEILIGRCVTLEHAQDLFDPASTSDQGLWCSNCFAHDSVEIPQWLKGRYFSAVEALPPCENCGAQPQTFWFERSKAEGHAYLFSTVRNTELQAWVEAQFAPQGIGSTHTAWHPGPASEPPFQEELMMAAWHPKRVERWLEAGVECEDM
jgi:hypothetical protein